MVEDNTHIYQRLLDNLNEGVYLLDRNRRITYWNKGAEKLTGYARSEVLGKSCVDTVHLHLDEMGKNICDMDCPVLKTLSDGITRELEIFLHHREGHRVPIQVRVVPLWGSDGHIIGAAEILTDNLPNATLKRRIEYLQKQSLLDPLTQELNRRGIEMNLTSRLEEMKRYELSFGLLFIDVDRFKDINDDFGHVTGDEVLKMVSKTLSNSIRPFDVLGRWGGEEFVVIIANVNRDALSAIAERCRFLVEHSGLPPRFGSVRVSVSIGATLSQSGDDIQRLIERADQLMYRSKKFGRNCVTTDIE